LASASRCARLCLALGGLGRAGVLGLAVCLRLALHRLRLAPGGLRLPGGLGVLLLRGLPDLVGPAGLLGLELRLDPQLLGLALGLLFGHPGRLGLVVGADRVLMCGRGPAAGRSRAAHGPPRTAGGATDISCCAVDSCCWANAGLLPGRVGVGGSPPR